MLIVWHQEDGASALLEGDDLCSTMSHSNSTVTVVTATSSSTATSCTDTSDSEADDDIPALLEVFFII